jgi:hypothetical protein
MSIPGITSYFFQNLIRTLSTELKSIIQLTFSTIETGIFPCRDRSGFGIESRGRERSVSNKNGDNNVLREKGCAECGWLLSPCFRCSFRRWRFHTLQSRLLSRSLAWRTSASLTLNYSPSRCPELKPIATPARFHNVLCLRRLSAFLVESLCSTWRLTN